jgi:hypothetical protein
MCFKNTEILLDSITHGLNIFSNGTAFRDHPEIADRIEVRRHHPRDNLSPSYNYIF